MAEFIENPFEEVWKSFDIEVFKEEVCKLIDGMSTTNEAAKLADAVRELDDLIMSYVVVLKFRGVESIEVIKASELPKNVLRELGFDETELIDGYIPKDLIPKDVLDIIKKSPPEKKNNWLIDP